MTDFSQPRPLPTYAALFEIAKKRSAGFSPNGYALIVADLGQQFEVSALPIAFLKIAAACAPGALDLDSAALRPELCAFRAFLYSPADHDAIRIVSYLLAPQFDRLAPFLTDERESIRSRLNSASDPDLKIKYARIIHQIDEVLLHMRTTQAFARVMEINAAVRKKGFPTPTRIVVQKPESDTETK